MRKRTIALAEGKSKNEYIRVGSTRRSLSFFIMPGIGKVSDSREKNISDGHINPDGNLFPIRILGIVKLLGCVGIHLYVKVTMKLNSREAEDLFRNNFFSPPLSGR